MALNVNPIEISPVENHREREKGALVYPVYSRRAGGLSIGINLYPDKKSCSFNCPYCAVFPFANNVSFSLERMEKDLRFTVAAAQEQSASPVKDICFSGSGEPTLSADFPNALKLAENIRAELTPLAKLVVITNGTGLLKPEVFSLLSNAAANPALDIWLKLDAGTPEWYQKINRSAIPHRELIAKIREFTACVPVTIQTMLCAINVKPPPPEETIAWESLLYELAANGHLRKVQLYGKARPAPEDPLTKPLPISYLEERAASLQKLIGIPVKVYP